MADHFDSPKILISRARDHINDLEARVKAFFERKPYSLVVERDSDTGQDVHKLRLTAPIPNTAAAIAKDAFSNLRDALDHAVYASTRTLRPGGKAARTAFPFAEDAATVHDKLNKELIDIPPDIRTFLEDLRPHKAGNQLLWGLARVRNVKTHRVLVPLVSASMGTSLGVNFGSIKGPSSIGYNKWDAAKNEVEFMRLGPGSQIDYKVSASLDVLLGDVETFGGQSALGTLKTVASEVERVVLGIEAET